MPDITVGEFVATIVVDVIYVVFFVWFILVQPRREKKRRAEAQAYMDAMLSKRAAQLWDQRHGGGDAHE